MADVANTPEDRQDRQCSSVSDFGHLHLRPLQRLVCYPTIQMGWHPMELQSVITCPECGHSATETMPIDACQYIYDCKGCGHRMKPIKGKCCVYCSYGSVPCPPIQEEGDCCAG
jgi:hypothetical protein